MKIKKVSDFEPVIQFLMDNFSSPTHWPDWNLVVSKYCNTEFFYLCAYEKDKLIGICPVHKEKKGVLSSIRSGQFRLIPFGGWLLSKPVEIGYNKLPVSCLTSLNIWGLPKLFEFNNALPSKRYSKKATLVVDLEKDVDSIWKEDLDSNRRNQIRKAEKKGVTVKSSLEDIDTFYLIYQQACERIGLSLMAVEYFIELFELSESIGVELLSAEVDGTCIANLLVIYDKCYSIHWISNMANNAPNHGQGELLVWTAINSMKEKGCKYYDLCHIDKERLPYLYRFKKGFSKNEVVVPYTSVRPLMFRVVSKLARTFTKPV